MMTRKQFRKIANVLNKFKKMIEPTVFSWLVTEMAYQLSTENNLFNMTKFKNACNDDMEQL